MIRKCRSIYCNYYITSHYLTTQKGATAMTIKLTINKKSKSKGEILAANGRNILQNRNL